MILEITSDCLQFDPVLLGAFRVETMIHMIVDERLLRVSDRTFDSLKLLRNIKTRAFHLNHPDHRMQMSPGTFKPRNQLGVSCMAMLICHV